MNYPLVSCITATYGRYNILKQAISCFIEQDYKNKELIILNNHPTPLFSDLPNVKIYNEAQYASLGLCRKRLLDLSNGEYIKIWDDDDLYLPWAISQCIEHVELTKKKLFWKPYSSWYWGNEKKIILTSNWFEASYIVHKSILQKYGFGNGGGDENLSWCDDGIQKKEGGVETTEVGILSHYIYRWGHFNSHISAFLGSGTLESRTKDWMSRNNDTGNKIPLETINLTKYWQQLLNDSELIFDNKQVEILKDNFKKFNYNI